MDMESQRWEDLVEESVPLNLARQLLQPMSFRSEFSAFDAIPNSLESIHQYAANAVLEQFCKQQSPRATVIMPEHTGLPQVGIKVLRTMLRIGMKVQIVVVIADQLWDSVATWQQQFDDEEVFCMSVDKRGKPLRIMANTSELGVHFSQHRAALTDFLEAEGLRIIICLGSRFEAVKLALEAAGKTIDLLIFEYFLSTTSSLFDVEKASLQNMFDDTYFPVHHRLCLSSTTISCQFQDNRAIRFGGIGSDIVQSLNLGPLAFHLPRSAAVQRGLLRPVKISPWSSVEMNQKFQAKDAKHQAKAVMFFLKKHPVKSLYAFFAKNDAAQEFHSHLDAMSQQAGSKVKSVLVRASENVSQRYEYSKFFSGEDSVVVSSVYILIENRSAPAAEAAFAPPYKVSSLHVQRMIGLVSKLPDRETAFDSGSWVQNVGVCAV